jgi:hypothetical protein
MGERIPATTAASSEEHCTGWHFWRHLMEYPLKKLAWSAHDHVAVFALDA